MVLLNPGQDALWKSHVILNGRSRGYQVRNFAGPLSIKAVRRGTATWETDEGRFEIGPGSCLVLNDRQPYTITVESRQVVETFCIFFSRGFVEDVARVMSHSDTELLTEPWKDHAIEFQERLRPGDRVLTYLLAELQCSGDERVVWKLAEELAKQHANARAQAVKLPASKASTRQELWRRLQRGRNVMEGAIGDPLDLARVARQAALSPYHFHRSFTRLFGETPHKYLTRRRMERAASLLKSTDMPVVDVCYACGYQSLSSFSGLFRKYAGVPPAWFRNSST